MSRALGLCCTTETPRHDGEALCRGVERIREINSPALYSRRDSAAWRCSDIFHSYFALNSSQVYSTSPLDIILHSLLLSLKELPKFHEIG